MITSLIGFTLFATSLIAYSTLHDKELRNTNFIKIKILGIGILILVLSFGFEGFIGLLIILKHLNKTLHIYGFSFILLLEAVDCIYITKAVYLHTNRIYLSKEGFDALIYALVLALTIHEIRAFLYKPLIIGSVVVLTLILLFLGILILKLHKRLEELADSINTTTSFKIFTFACILYGFAGISSINSSSNMCLFLLFPSHLILLTSGMILYYELYVKYIKPFYSFIK